MLGTSGEGGAGCAAGDELWAAAGPAEGVLR